MHTSALLLLAASRTILAQVAAPEAEAAKIEYIDPPNESNGWCYWCSDDDAPPLCNSQCQTAISRLCADTGVDRTNALTDTEGDCTIKYMPETYEADRNGARQPAVSGRICRQAFSHILANCGKDASTPYTNAVDPNYCTTSGGGGTFGWKDDGTVVEGSARYVITTRDTDQCGQHKASWQDADKVIKWNPVWVPENAQVKLDTNPPPLTGEMANLAASIPEERPECKLEQEVCDLRGQPFYAHTPTDPWSEGGRGMERHRMVFEGWSDDEGATAFKHSLTERCGTEPGNYQSYKNDTGGPQHIVDFDLPIRTCSCASWAAFDASGGGISLPETAFCGPSVPDAPLYDELRKRSFGDELRKRSFGRSLFKPVQGGPAPIIKPRMYR